MSVGKTEASPSHANAVLHACRKHAVANEWTAVIDKTEDRALQILQPQLVMQRLYAALMLKEEVLVAQVTERVLEPDISVGVKLAAVKELALREHAEKGARILISDPGAQSSPKFGKAARHVFKHLQDPILKKQLKDCVSTFRGGGDLIKTDKTPFKFRQQPKNEIWGTVALTASPTTPSRHAELLAADAAKFRESAEVGRQPLVREYQNVFTEPSGQIWTEKGELIIPRGIPMATLDRASVETISIGFAGNRGSRGIYHWIADYLPRLAWIPDSDILEDESFKILLNGKNPGFEQVTLDILGFGEAAKKLTGPVFVERLLLAPVTFKGMVGWKHLDPVYETLGEEASRMAAEHGIALPERLYITRRDADRRVLTNEAEIETLARERGFEIQEFSSIPLWHQIALARHASVIMAPHGAGLSHIVFSRPGTMILELLPIKDGSYALRFNYARLSIAKGHDYRAWLEEQQILVNSWTIDLDSFAPFLDSALHKAE
ncbi:glycosyltransferase family 61 protein [Methylobacterium bullatum]|uniref:EGF domain-specific O-linked N-acetylglucosamine transferase n=1 Tax=Methylobacterium bullatum TaxID=570505 RepID=A0A679JX58_9HYPH|nr:hypothetical protein MBLL_01689 [Methylobacterium bullatum]